jgi:hypothetical protein
VHTVQWRRVESVGEGKSSTSFSKIKFNIGIVTFDSTAIRIIMDK